MKTREEIWDGIDGETSTRDLVVDILETVLDIRDLLANPPLEITGKEMSAEELLITNNT